MNDVQNLMDKCEVELLKTLCSDDNSQANINKLVEKLTDEEEARVSNRLRPGQSGIVSQYINATVEHKDICTLKPEVWLNDEVINFYTTLLSDRAENNQYLSSIHCFNTQFCTTFREQGYKKVRRWTKNVDVFAHDYLLIPIN